MELGMTELILNKVIEIMDRNEPYEKIFKGDSDSLVKMLEELAYERIPTFGDYIRAYLYENHEELNLKYSSAFKIPEDKLWTCIKESFKANGMKGRGDLFSNKINLSVKKDMLVNSGIAVDMKRARQKSMSIARNDIFLFAFGLGMDSDDVSRLLCNALLTYDFNPKDYREVIYYWCLNRNNKTTKISPYEKMIELMKFYDKCKPQTGENPESHTIVLNGRMRGLNSEEEVWDYLLRLKGSNAENLALKGITESFDSTVRMLKESLGYPHYNENQKLVDIGLDALISEVRLERKDIYENYIKNNNKKPDNGLIKESVLGKLFEGITFSKKSFEHRMSTKSKTVSRTSASRRELLINSFIIFCNKNINENEDWFENIENRYPDFDEYVEPILERCNMTSYSVYNGPGLYLKNPFELFLAICLLQKDPYEYFMASWESADQYNENQAKNIKES